MGGITAGVVALPLALAFGVASGLGPAAGLWGAILVGFFAAVAGGTPAQVSGPTGPLTVVVAGLVAAGAHGPQQVFLAITLAGLLQIAFGLLRLGGFIRYVPYPVVSGFMTGIGVIIVILQLLPLLGAPVASGVMASLKGVPAALGQANLAAVGVGLAAIALVYASKALAPRLPGALVALLATTVAAWLIGLDVPRIGAIPTGLPALTLPPLDAGALIAVLPAAMMLAMLASIDSLLTSLVADQLTRTSHNSDRELLGQGLGNAVAGLVGGLPGAGATMRTVVNIQAGGRTSRAGAIHSLFLLAMVLGLAPLAALVPLAALAGILVTVGLGILDMKGLRQAPHVPRADAAIMIVVLAMTVFDDLIQAVAVGMVMACLVFAKRLGDVDVARTPHEEAPGIWIVPATGVLFFGNATPLRIALGQLPEGVAVVLDLTHTPFMDQSGALALAEVAKDLATEGSVLHIAGARAQPAMVLAATRAVNAEQMHDGPDEAIAALLLPQEGPSG